MFPENCDDAHKTHLQHDVLELFDLQNDYYFNNFSCDSDDWMF